MSFSRWIREKEGKSNDNIRETERPWFRVSKEHLSSAEGRRIPDEYLAILERLNRYTRERSSFSMGLHDDDTDLQWTEGTEPSESDTQSERQGNVRIDTW